MCYKSRYLLPTLHPHAGQMVWLAVDMHHQTVLAVTSLVNLVIKRRAKVSKTEPDQSVQLKVSFYYFLLSVYPAVIFV